MVNFEIKRVKRLWKIQERKKNTSKIILTKKKKVCEKVIYLTAV